MNSIDTSVKKSGRPKKVDENYTLTLTLGDAVYSSSGVTLSDALRSLETPRKIVTKGFLKVRGNGKEFERMFTPVALKRFLWPIGRTIQAKMLSVALR